MSISNIRGGSYDHSQLMYSRDYFLSTHLPSIPLRWNRENRKLQEKILQPQSLLPQLSSHHSHPQVPWRVWFWELQVSICQVLSKGGNSRKNPSQYPVQCSQLLGWSGQRRAREDTTTEVCTDTCRSGECKVQWELAWDTAMFCFIVTNMKLGLLLVSCLIVM